MHVFLKKNKEQSVLIQLTHLQQLKCSMAHSSPILLRAILSGPGDFSGHWRTQDKALRKKIPPRN